MKKILAFTLLFIMLLIISCEPSFENWVVVYDKKDYDLIQYDEQTDVIWLSNNFAKEILSLHLEETKVNPIRKQKVYIPNEASLTTFCILNDALWVIADNELFKYSLSSNTWEEFGLIDIDSFLRCKVLSQGQILFTGTTDNEYVNVIYQQKHNPIYINLPYEPYDIAQDLSNQLWFITTENGIWKLDNNNQWILWKPINGERLFFTTDTLWVAKDGLLYYSQMGNNINLEAVDNLVYDLTLSVYQSEDGRIWIVTQSGIWEFDNGAIKKIPQPKHIGHINIQHGFNSTTNTLFVSTENGIYAVTLK